MACNGMDGMMSSGAMYGAMAIGWVIAVLVGLAAIFALVCLGIFLLRRSQPRLPAASHSPPVEPSSAPLRDVRAPT